MNSSLCNTSGCGKAGGKRCSQCKSVFYCDENCQRKDWKAHRAACKTIKKQLEEAKQKNEDLAMSDPPMSSWARGLSPEKQREWLVDCFRLRLDDEYAIGGEVRCGTLYDSGSADEVVQDFLVFCRLAQKQDVLPSGWNWGAFLATAANLIPFAFEKSDAQEKYGSENVFMAAMGGRSLRYTGELIYGSAISMMGGKDSKQQQKMQEKLLYRQRTPAMVANVGGEQVWDTLEMEINHQL